MPNPSRLTKKLPRKKLNRNDWENLKDDVYVHLLTHRRLEVAELARHLNVNNAYVRRTVDMLVKDGRIPQVIWDPDKKGCSMLGETMLELWIASRCDTDDWPVCRVSSMRKEGQRSVILVRFVR